MKQNRILIVAAQPQYRAAMAEYLRGQEGIARVREADNGTEALQILTEEKFDILITDMIMPWTAIRCWRSWDADGWLPIPPSSPYPP